MVNIPYDMVSCMFSVVFSPGLLVEHQHDMEIEVSACFWRSMPMYYETQAYKIGAVQNLPLPQNARERFRSILFRFLVPRKNPNSNILNFTTGNRWEALGQFQNLSRITMGHEVWPPMFHLHRWELLLKLMTDWWPTKSEEIQAKLMFFSGLKVEHIKKNTKFQGPSD